MAAQMTKIANLINPERLGAYLEVKLVDAIKLSPLVMIDRTLEGSAGDTLSLPKYQYIGDANAVPEGEAMVPVALNASKEDVKVAKIGKAVEITDEAVLSAYGNPVDEIGKQLLVAIASKIEDDLFTELRTATLNVTYTGAFAKEIVVDAQLKFGEDINEAMYLMINPAEYAILRKDKDFVAIQQGERVISGHVGRIYGCDVIVANRVKAGEAFVMKHNALALVMKRKVQCEQDRDILKMTNVFTANEHYAVQLRYDDRVVKIGKAGA